jgi:hypothetical protein
MATFRSVATDEQRRDQRHGSARGGAVGDRLPRVLVHVFIGGVRRGVRSTLHAMTGFRETGAGLAHGPHHTLAHGFRRGTALFAERLEQFFGLRHHAVQFHDGGIGTRAILE